MPASWQDRAACAGHPEFLWWPPERTDPDGRPIREQARDRRRRVARAKAICAACPVRRDCLADQAPRIARLANPSGWVVGGVELDNDGQPVLPEVPKPWVSSTERAETPRQAVSVPPKRSQRIVGVARYDRMTNEISPDGWYRHPGGRAS